MVIESTSRIVALEQEAIIVLATENVSFFMWFSLTFLLEVIPILISYYA